MDDQYRVNNTENNKEIGIYLAKNIIQLIVLNPSRENHLKEYGNVYAWHVEQLYLVCKYRFHWFTIY